MPTRPVVRCDECGYEATVKTDVCLSCGERIQSRIKGGVKGLIRSIILIAIAIYILLSSFKVFGFSLVEICCG